MSLFYEYELIEEKGKTTLFNIIEVYDENSQYYYEKKNSIRAANAKSDIWDYVVEEVENNKLITGAKAARHFKKSPTQQFQDYSEQWLTRQSQNILKLNYKSKQHRGIIGSPVDRVWVYLDRSINEYIELNQEQLDFMLSCLSGAHDREWCKKLYETICCEDSPLTPDEKSEIIEKTMKSNWTRATSQFQKEYGFIPFVINRYANNNMEINLDEAPEWMKRKIQ